MKQRIYTRVILSSVVGALAFGCGSSREVALVDDAGHSTHDGGVRPIDEADGGRSPDPSRVITDEDWQRAVRAFCQSLEACEADGPLPLEPGADDGFDDGFDDDGDPFGDLCDDPAGAGSIGGELWRRVFESQACAEANTLLLECAATALGESCFDDVDAEPCAAEEQQLVDSCSWGALLSE